MRALDPRLLLAAGGAVAVAIVLVVLLAAPSPAPAATFSLAPACGAEPRPFGPLEVGSNQSLGLWSRHGGAGRASTWASASVPYDLYLLDAGEYAAFSASGSGFNDSAHAGPPAAWAWTSGATESSNSSFAFTGGGWFLIAYDPSPGPAYLLVADLACGSS